MKFEVVIRNRDYVVKAIGSLYVVAIVPDEAEAYSICNWLNK